MGTFADDVANSFLNAFARNTSYVNAAVWVKLHLDDPGAAGLLNEAAETTRQQATFGSDASGRTISNTAALEWLNVSDTETYTHISLWTASSGGTFLGRDELSAPADVTAADTFRILTGELELSFT